MNKLLSPNATTLNFKWGAISHLFPNVKGVSHDSGCEVDIDYTTKGITIYQDKVESPIVELKDNLKMMDELQAIVVETTA